MKAIDCILVDEGFTIPSTLAQEARKIARPLKSWCEVDENKVMVNEFAAYLSASISNCFYVASPRVVTEKTKREHMWAEFHQLRTSTSFVAHWRAFLCDANSTTLPTFYQHITTSVFTELIHCYYPVPVSAASTTTEESHKDITFECTEICCWIYTKKAEDNNWEVCSPLKEQLNVCLEDILDEEEDLNDVDDSTEWVNAIDRGGLVHVSSATYTISCLLLNLK